MVAPFSATSGLSGQQQKQITKALGSLKIFNEVGKTPRRHVRLGKGFSLVGQSREYLIRTVFGDGKRIGIELCLHRPNGVYIGAVSLIQMKTIAQMIIISEF